MQLHTRTDNFADCGTHMHRLQVRGGSYSTTTPARVLVMSCVPVLSGCEGSTPSAVAADRMLREYNRGDDAQPGRPQRPRFHRWGVQNTDLLLSSHASSLLCVGAGGRWFLVSTQLGFSRSLVMKRRAVGRCFHLPTNRQQRGRAAAAACCRAAAIDEAVCHVKQAGGIWCSVCGVNDKGVAAASLAASIAASEKRDLDRNYKQPWRTSGALDDRLGLSNPNAPSETWQ